MHAEEEIGALLKKGSRVGLRPSVCPLRGACAGCGCSGRVLGFRWTPSASPQQNSRRGKETRLLSREPFGCVQSLRSPCPREEIGDGPWLTKGLARHSIGTEPFATAQAPSDTEIEQEAGKTSFPQSPISQAWCVPLLLSGTLDPTAVFPADPVHPGDCAAGLVSLPAAVAGDQVANPERSYAKSWPTSAPFGAKRHLTHSSLFPKLLGASD